MVTRKKAVLMDMRIFTGTLYSGENEFKDCVASISHQTYQNFQHYIFRDLPNRVAHHTLFSRFLKQADEFNILIKVDADMVLCSNDLFLKIVEKMTTQPDIDVFTIAVQDFFSGTLINGLNTYRNTVKWNLNKDTVFVDIPETSLEKCFYDKTILAPAAVHCKNPSTYQAFHYGVHRGFKSIASRHSSTHWELLEKTRQNFLRTQDARIGLAVLGAELVYAGVFNLSDVDYTNPRVKQELERYEHLENRSLQQEITRQRLNHWGFLPGDLRRRLLRKLRGNQA